MNPRERLRDRGANALSDAELLALLLRTGVQSSNRWPALSVLQVAEVLIRDWGGLKEVIVAATNGLVRLRGLGPAKLASLSATAEIARRVWTSGARAGRPISCVDEARELFSWLMLEEREVLAGAFLDTRHRVVKERVLFQGTVDGVTARPREILREALRANASAILVSHNHPSGDASPSPEDDRFTERLRISCEEIGVRFLDHLILAPGGGWHSYARVIPSSRAKRGPLLLKRPAFQSPEDPAPSWQNSSTHPFPCKR